MSADDLYRLAADLGRASVNAATGAAVVVAKTAADIERAAKAAAPVDTGALRNSITSTVHGLTAEIGPTVHYGGYVEHGTSHTSPQPYLGPAAERCTPAFVTAMERLAQEGL